MLYESSSLGLLAESMLLFATALSYGGSPSQSEREARFQRTALIVGVVDLFGHQPVQRGLTLKIRGDINR